MDFYQTTAWMHRMMHSFPGKSGEPHASPSHYILLLLVYSVLVIYKHFYWGWLMIPGLQCNFWVLLEQYFYGLPDSPDSQYHHCHTQKMC